MKNNFSAKIKKIGVIWANPYSPNLGVAALAYSVIYILNSIKENYGLNFDLFLVGSSKNGPDKITIFDKTIAIQNIKRKKFFSLKALIFFFLSPSRSEIFNSLKFDYVLDIAEGDSYTDLYGKPRFYLMNNSKRFFSIIRKKQFLLPQTIGPFTDKKIKKTAFKTLRKINQICVRDNLSLNFVTDNLPGHSITESIDLAFILPFYSSKKVEDRIQIGINISALLYGGGYTNNNQFNLKVDYKDLIQRIIEYFMSFNNVDIHLVGHVFAEGREIENDMYANEIYYNKFPSLILAPKFTNPIKAKSYISNLDFFIGSRMHACIAAYSSGVPVFPLAYSRKFNGLFQETLGYNYMGDCVNQTSDFIFEKLKNAYSERMIIKNEIAESREKIVKPRFEIIKKLVTEFLEIEKN